MSAPTYTYDSNIGYDSPGVTFDGDGYSVNRTRLPDALFERLSRPNVTVSILITVIAGYWLKGALVHSGRVMKFENIPTFVEAVHRNNGEVSLTKETALVDCVATSGTFYYDSAAQILYVNPPGTGSFRDDTYQAKLYFYFSKIPKKLRGLYWDARLQSSPDISLRIESRFSGVGQIGGGKVVLANADGYFDTLDETIQWDAGQVIMELGLDLPTAGGEMDEGDYQKVGTWRIEKNSREGLNFTLTLREAKTNLEKKIPRREFTRAEFPNIAEDLIGKPIPMAWGQLYGVKPVLINKGTKKFKVADHAIRSFEAVRIKTEDEGWKEIPFATRDLTTATFTLGSEWEDEDVSVDIFGRINKDGSLMENPADIMADLLDYVGEQKIDVNSFATSRAWYRKGTDRYGHEVTLLAPCIFLDEHRTAIDVASEINNIAGSFLFVDYAGRWRYGAFIPVRAEDLDPLAGSVIQKFSERDIVQNSISKSVDSSKLFSKVLVRHSERRQDEWAQSVTEEVSRNQYIHNLPPQFTETRTLGLGKQTDAQHWAQRFLTTSEGGEPLVTYTFRVPWAGFFLMPGDKVKVEHDRYDLNSVLEIYEASYSLTSPPTVKLVCGNMRGWKDTFGFWIGEGADTGIPKADLKLWLKAGEIPLAHGDAIQSWPDASGNHNDATQSILANRPLFSAINGPNDGPAVVFGVGQFLDLPDFASGYSQGEIFAVIHAPLDPATDAFGNVPWDFGSAGAGDFTQYPRTDGIIVEGFGQTAAVTEVDPAPALDQWRIYNVASSATEFTARLDNSSIYTTGVGLSQGFQTSMRVGGTAVDPAYYFGGYIAEIIIYNRILSAAERTQVIQDLSDRYTLGITAPASSPDWDAGWDDDEVSEARQNRGYWTGVDGDDRETDMADATDARSFEPSRWF